METLQGIIFSQLALALLLFVHEMGHYLALKAFKIKVDTFALGIGKGLTLFKYNNTEFKISPLLIGAYVSPNLDEYEATSPYKKLIVSVSGCLLGLLFAVFIFAFIFLKYLNCNLWDSIGYAFQFAYNIIMVVFHLIGNVFSWLFHLVYDKLPHAVSPVVNQAHIATQEYAATQTPSATDNVGKFSSNYTFMQGVTFVKGLVLLGMLSVFMNIVNLLPILPLDGGQVVVYVYEILFKKKFPKSLRTGIVLVGILILLSLFLISLFNDVKTFF